MLDMFGVNCAICFTGVIFDGERTEQETDEGREVCNTAIGKILERLDVS